MLKGSILWSWQRAQATELANTARVTVSSCSSATSAANCALFISSFPVTFGLVWTLCITGSEFFTFIFWPVCTARIVGE